MYCNTVLVKLAQYRLSKCADFPVPFPKENPFSAAQPKITLPKLEGHSTDFGITPTGGPSTKFQKPTETEAYKLPPQLSDVYHDRKPDLSPYMYSNQHRSYLTDLSLRNQTNPAQLDKIKDVWSQQYYHGTGNQVERSKLKYPGLQALMAGDSTRRGDYKLRDSLLESGAKSVADTMFQHGNPPRAFSANDSYYGSLRPGWNSPRLSMNSKVINRSSDPTMPMRTLLHETTHGLGSANLPADFSTTTANYGEMSRELPATVAETLAGIEASRRGTATALSMQLPGQLGLGQNLPNLLGSLAGNEAASHMYAPQPKWPYRAAYEKARQVGYFNPTSANNTANVYPMMPSVLREISHGEDNDEFER